MSSNRKLLASFTIVAVIVAGSAAPANADIGRRLFRGITFALSPSIGTLQNGPLADQNVFRQHIIRNIPGQGWGYEFTRLWGADSFGNPQQLDLGAVNASLQGQTHVRGTLNRRIIPEINIQADTGGAPLNYAFDMFTGPQNFRLQGSFTGNLTGSINALGFYRLQVNGQNANSNRTAEGWFYTDDQSTDFDVGPINVSGNIFLDLAAGVFQAFANTPGALQALVPSAASGAARVKPEETLTSALNLALEGGNLDPQQLLAGALVRALFEQQLMDLTPGELATMQSAAAEFADENAALAASQPLVVPEPGTLVLLLAPGLLLAWRRK